MCLGVPMQIEFVNGIVARCRVRGISREVNLLLMEGAELGPGDFVLVHVGYAIQKIGQVEARTAWELHDAMVRRGDA